MNRAKELLEKAIELGSGSAAYRLGWMYERGFLSEEPDYVKALEFYEKAASLNNADGYCRVALYLANGYSGVKDPVKSREYYEKASRTGCLLCPLWNWHSYMRMAMEWRRIMKSHLN